MRQKVVNSADPEFLHVNKIVTLTLTTGMYVTIGIYLIGVLLSFIKLNTVPAISNQYFGSAGTFFAGLFHLDPRAFLFLGTVTLIFTPVACVLFSAFFFWKSRDFRYAGVTSIVFLVIMISMVVGSIFKVKVG